MNGNLVWTTVFGTSSGDFGFEIKQVGDGGFVIGGAVNELDDMLFAKLDENGKFMWGQAVQGDNYIRKIFSMDVTKDGGFIATGISIQHDNLSKGNIPIIRLDSDGRLLWAKILGGSMQTMENLFMKPQMEDLYLAVGLLVLVLGGKM